MLRVAGFCLLLGGVNGHAAMTIPTSRNAVEGLLPPYSSGGSNATTCTCGNLKNTPCEVPDARKGANGQPCLWWSQGCSIGCDYCLTDPRHPNNNGKIPTAPITGAWPHADKAGFRTSYCSNPKTESVLPKEYWTMNIHAIPGAVNDSYRYNPWRAPGTAPVIDPCGQAGGKYRQTPVGGDSVFANATVDGITYSMGDLGSVVLPPTPAHLRPKWKLGGAERVAWGMRFNHGGGYQYRLCPAEKMPCTEEDFQELPLDFVRDSHAIMWNNGTLRPIPGKFVDDTVCPVVPKGSTWARNPIPRIHTDNIGMAFVGKCKQRSECSQKGAPWCNFKDDCQQFPSPCPEIDDAQGWWGGNRTHMPTSYVAPDFNQHEGACSGDWTLGMISDEVKVPETLKPGHYVLSWRWDCEETAQVWSNCADVELTA